jgi:hypothetical protein
LARLERFMGAPGPSLAYIHAISGLGKSVLVDELARRSRELGVHVVRIDGRDVEPTERGVLGELGRLAGEDLKSCDAVAQWLRRFDRVLLVIDDIDALRLLDAWLWRSLLPSLPENVDTVLTGRHVPVPAWFQTSLSVSPVTLELQPLPDADAIALLRAGGLDSDSASRINRIARGYPLALMLAASCYHFIDDIDFHETAELRIADQLAQKFLAEISDPTVREALECSSIVRVINVPLLQAMLPGADAVRTFEQLRTLALVKTARDGVVLHEAIRGAIARNLRVTDPQRFLAYRRKSWTYVTRELKTAPASELWRYTADLLFMLETPVIREAFFPSGARHLVVEPARKTDASAIIALARRYDGADAAHALECWLARIPQAFTVVRDHQAKLVGYYVLADATEISDNLVRDVAVAHDWWTLVRNEPMQAGESALFLRRWHSEGDGEAPCAAQAACWLDIKRTYLAKRPALRRVYLTLRDLGPYEAAATELTFTVLSDSVTLDGEVYRTALLDMGPQSVDGWLASLAAAQLGSCQQLLDVASRELVVDDRRVPLTRREFQTMAHLVERSGAIVSRDDLIAGVWGSESDIVSNVVDTTIRSLRKKLADRSSVIETVSGIGYRFRGN